MSDDLYSLKNNFYREFEDRFRGSTDLILERLHVYKPFVQPLIKIHKDDALAIDLGCGRGEWLGFLTDLGFICQGVDLDDGMLDECKKNGYNVRNMDALEAIQGLPDSSYSIISGFHIVEHIPFDILLQLVTESLRVLKPGGLLILETPNPENVSVGSNTFYLDPTHTKPIPNLLLSFVAEFAGYNKVKTLRLQEDEAVFDREISLMDTFGATSPDYSVVAQKNASPSILDEFKIPFEKNFGITIQELTSRYDAKREQKINEINNQLIEANRSIQHLIFENEELELRLIDEHKKLEVSLIDEHKKLDSLIANLNKRAKLGPLRIKQLFTHPKKFAAHFLGLNK